MRTHISLPDDLVEEIDRLAGPRRRSEFIEESVRLKLINERQKQAIEKLRDWPELDPARYPYWPTPEKTSQWVHDMRREGEQQRMRDLDRLGDGPLSAR